MWDNTCGESYDLPDYLKLETVSLQLDIHVGTLVNLSSSFCHIAKKYFTI